MPIKTQVHILKLSASCPSVRTLVVFQDDKWTSPRKGYFMNQIFSLFLLSRHSDDCICFVFHGAAAVVSALNEYSANREWALFRVVKTAMFSSREKKTCRIFRRRNFQSLFLIKVSISPPIQALLRYLFEPGLILGTA
jgi:hypothetical protein